MFRTIRKFFKKYLKFEPTVVSPFGKKIVGGKLSLKSRDEQREQKIKALISEYTTSFFMDVDELVLDIGLDSLDCIELTMDLEETFEIEITDEDAEKCETVEDVYALVEKYVRK